MSSPSQPLARPVVAAPSKAAEFLSNVLVVSALATAVLSAFVLYGLGGWAYYGTSADLRSTADAYRMLRPSGYAGHLFGVGGFILMLVPIVYSIRKKVRKFRNLGGMKMWLDVHIFCGIVGPVLVTYHTSFKFNGLISVAYWSMMAVVLSGFVGRYLWVRIPRSLRGLEMTHGELDERAAALNQELAAADLPPELFNKIAEFEHHLVPPEGRPRPLIGLLISELTMRRALVKLQREVEHAGPSSALLHHAAHAIAERAALIRQGAYLEKTKKLFDLWHIFHMPLVYVMFVIVVLHVAVTLYMGYVPFVA
jgi:hypothetical protein